jgi:hypothetical protein
MFPNRYVITKDTKKERGKNINYTWMVPSTNMRNGFSSVKLFMHNILYILLMFIQINF